LLGDHNRVNKTQDASHSRNTQVRDLTTVHQNKSKKWIKIGAGLAILVVVVLVIVLPITLVDHEEEHPKPRPPNPYGPPPIPKPIILPSYYNDYAVDGNVANN